VLTPAAVTLLAAFPAAHPGAERTPVYSFDDRDTAYDGGHPPWFEESFLYLDDHLDEALDKGKSGFLVYFGQTHCASCQAIMSDTLTPPDMVECLSRHLDIVGLSIHDIRKLIAPDGW
jgi:thioredoxin-related protein